ncbi:hypothetical protein [Salmonella enterica]|uniref:hypothetical protein n=1 Tax=Salmonella enterica TaxID=28901 RepID=UPI0012D527A4|nr:hypothetical protein [Salmonella enterica]EBV1219422.1 hypothetical protein [Salmonella enterica subsp. enterica serovar Neunkirchen]
MIELNIEQAENISKMERENIINSLIKDIESKGILKIKKRDTLELRLTKALNYAKKVNIKHSGMLRSFLYLEIFQPGFSSLPAIRKAIEESNDPEQRYKDIINIAVNLLNRER